MINTELHNGDCLEYMKKIPTSSIDLIITDPPYNLGKFMEERDTNLVKMRDNFFGAAGWDDLDYKEWKKSMNKFFHQASRVLKDGGSIIVFMAIIKVETIIQLAQKHGLYYKTTGIWHKSNPMPRNMNLHFVNSTESWIYFTYKTKTGTFNNNGKVLHIEIIGLREKWNKKRIENLNKYLERTYHDTSMEIRIISDNYDEIVVEHFPKAEVGINCRSNIVLKYNQGILVTSVESDEFENEALKYCSGIDIKKYETKTDIVNELKGNKITELLDADIQTVVNDIGEFSANLYFNISTSKDEKEKFLYKYLNTPKNIESGIILYRNAFSISSYEGRKDWLGLGKRSRKSPAAASHPTGAWRVRENQMAGYVMIDKKKNAVLQDMANRQGLDENIYYQLFVEIILVGIKEFERYRQNIVRKINAKNQVEGQKATPISDRVLNRPTSVSGLTKEEAKQLATEIKSYKKEGKQYQKDKEAVEARYKYDVRILNVLATTGLKASSIAHEMKNDRNAIYDNYNNIVDALKEYGMWDELNSSEKTRKSYKNVPYLLESNDVVGRKLVTFMDTMLEEIEKKQFEIRYQSIADILTVIKKVWERDYAWLSIEITMDEDIVYQISEDILQVIFDNLILNSVQQNENTQKLMITISINETNGFLNIKYCDNGKGLDDKYKTDPMKILEVHETTRTNGHGLGMWIVNNTCTMSGGEIQKICGEKGFEIEFTIGGKI